LPRSAFNHSAPSYRRIGECYGFPISGLCKRQHIFRSNNRSRKTTKPFLGFAMKLVHSMVPPVDRFFIHHFAFAYSSANSAQSITSRSIPRQGGWILAGGLQTRIATLSNDTMIGKLTLTALASIL
jgi:hypothetical protein